MLRDGRTYTEYLSCLIFLMDRKTRNFRMMDLIQWNIRTEQADFSVANCAYQIEIEAEVLQKHMFFRKRNIRELCMWRIVLMLWKQPPSSDCKKT